MSHARRTISLFIFQVISPNEILVHFITYSYYAFQYPLDFGADVTRDSCLTTANFRSFAAYSPQKHQTSCLCNEGSHSTLIKKGTIPIKKKKVAKNYDRAAGCRIRLF